MDSLIWSNVKRLSVNPGDLSVPEEEIRATDGVRQGQRGRGGTVGLHRLWEERGEVEEREDPAGKLQEERQGEEKGERDAI